MAGIESLMVSQAPPPGAQPQTLQDPEQALAGFLQSLTPENMVALREVQADLVEQDAEALAGLSDIFDFLEANPGQYAATVAELIEDDVLDDDTLPPQYDERFVKLMNALVKSAMQEVMDSEGPAPQAFAQGGLASLGRGGDSVLAHVTPGEAYLLRSRGGAASVNPYTGHPEFFLKKIAKGVKKAVKGVGKVLKKAAPVVLPIVLSMTPLGPIAGGALGSALGAAINGASLKDSLKAGLMGAVAGGVFAGAQGALGGEGFMAGVRGGLPAGMRPAQAALAQAAQTPGVDALQSIDTGGLPGLVPEGGSVAAQRAAEGLGSQLPGAAQGALQPIDTSALPQAIPEGGTVGSPQAGQSTLQRFTDPVKDFYSERLSPSRGVPTPADITGSQSYQDLVRQGITADKAFDMVSKQMTPGMLSRYGPLAAVGAGAAYLGGLFDQPELEYPGLIPGETGMDLYEANPELYSGYSGGSPNQSFQAQPPPQPQYTQVGARPPVMAGIPSLTQSFQQARGFAGGGTTYARGGPPVRARGAIRGPGTERSDDIPAWLSDGEFVITAKAVRGAGGGDPRRGAKTMYELMNRLERQA